MTAKSLALCGSVSGSHKWDVSGSVSLTSPLISEEPAVCFAFSLPSPGSISGIPSRKIANALVCGVIHVCVVVYVWKQIQIKTQPLLG